MRHDSSSFIFSNEVSLAIENNSPIVALESTIISHGMPYPFNLEVALEVEEAVRNNGAVPATIAILEGQVHIGLNQSELQGFAQTKSIVKCSRRDLPFVIAKRLNGATTVASTMLFANQMGIRFFATGGIGGVHRGAEFSWDVSADLLEFTHSNVAVFSAGAKAILDLPKTLEYLETLGVPVIGFQTDEFPAFYSQTSGLKLAMSVQDEEALANVLWQGWNRDVLKGALIANPIPSAHALDHLWIENYIAEAIESAKRDGIAGKDLTPHLLKKLNASTSGHSQQANRALVLNNAALAARVAVAYANFK